MMRRNLYILAIASLLSGNYVFAQDAVKQWSLEECIQYAIEHNIDLKQKEQEQESRKVDLHTSKYSWLPALNGSLGQSFQFGRSTSKSGVIVDQNAANSTLGINLDMPLFDGLKIPNDIAARKLDLKASIENLNKAREDLSINIASYYLQVLYNKELLKIAQLQVELDKEQVNKTEAMVNAGKVPLSQLYDIKAQLAKDEVTLTESQNNVNLALLDLAQSLELERSDRSFDIQTPVIEDAVADNMSSILPPENIYDHAVTFKPQIKEQQYLLESQKKMLRVAQAGYYPKLNFGASYSNGYYHSTSGGEFADTRSFSEQFKQNGQKIVGFSLSIPLFNRFQVRNSVRTARINIINRELLMENTKKTLYKEIQQAYYNATASQEKYTASDKSVTASKEAFNYAQERYNAGKSTVFEFKPVTPEEIEKALTRGVKILEAQAQEQDFSLTVEDHVLRSIALSCGGDVRKSINTLEVAFLSAPVTDGVKSITAEQLRSISQRAALRYDKSDDVHYDLLSALQKSIRGSDENAALHYLARLLEAGDLISPCRRLLVIASEDVGMAYPMCAVIVKACVDSALQLGLPEARIPLAQAVVTMATAPKSNSSYMAINQAIADVRAGKIGDFPRCLQNKHFDGAEVENKGQFYKYPHDYPDHYVRQQYLPDILQGTVYYHFGQNKTEDAARRYRETLLSNLEKREKEQIN